MKKSVYLIIIIFFSIVVSATEIGDIENSDWYVKAIQNIEESEYYIKYDEASNAYQSPNRANNLRFTYYDNGFKVNPRDNSNDWDVEIRLKSYGREEQINYYGNSIITDKHTMIVHGNDLDIEYINNKKGMRQDFIVNNKPSGDNQLILNFTVLGNNVYEVKPDKVVFKDKNHTIMEYKDLNIYDADKKELNGKFKETDEGFEIIVYDINALYPITIDPLSANYNWMAASDQDTAYFGYGTSSAGDVNGDGYSDIIIGAYYYSNGERREGAVFVYYGSSSGPSLTPDCIIESNIIGQQIGYKVSYAGDVNGDGYSDVIVGSLKGAAYVYYGSPTGLNQSADWTYQTSGSFGIGVSSAGDVNGDGYSDVIVGAYVYESNGAAFVFLGSENGLEETPDWIGRGHQGASRYGRYVACAGDVNGDGYSDVIVSEHYYTNPETHEGAAYVYHGSPSGLSSSYDWMCESNQVYAMLGTGVSSAGDVNGDGYSDIVVDASTYDNGEGDEGAAFVYHGSPTGLSSNHDWMGEINKSNARFGWSGVSPISDINGDGFGDIIIGAWKYSNDEAIEGAAFVYYGSSSGLNSEYDWMFELNRAYSEFGVDVSSAGDVNGDGYTDILVGAWKYDNFDKADAGAAFLFYGSGTGLSDTNDIIANPEQSYARFGASVSSAGDVNGDGYTDVIVGADDYDNGQIDEGAAFIFIGGEEGLDTIPSWMGESDQAYANYGISVSSAGDINGDGFSDVVVGADQYDVSNIDEGAAFVYYGSSTGMGTSYEWMGSGTQDSSGYGTAVSYVGDVNGDGYSDIIVGANKYNNGENNEGAVFVYYGSELGLSTAYDWMTDSDQDSSNFGIDVGCAGDVNGDGCSDIIVGANGYDNGQEDEGAAFVYLGSPVEIDTNYYWMGESNQDYANYGIGVYRAGDVNGDGYSDIIVGADCYDNGELDEGAAFVYHGSSVGLSNTYDWMAESNQTEAHFGRSVSTAGDVSGDGYSDVIVGAYLYDDKKINQGAAFVYYGNETGLDTFYHWRYGVNQADAWYGYDVACAGYINGNGFSDVIIGAPYYDNGNTDEGSFFIHYGNHGAGPFIPKQKKADDSGNLVAPLGNLNDTKFIISLIGKDFINEGKVKLQWEVKPLGTPFDGTGLGESADWIDVSGATKTTEINETVTGLSNNTSYKWRVRIKYDMTTGIPQPHSRWYYISDNAPTEVDLKTGSTVMINEININSMIIDDCIYLSVMGNGDRYVINKEETGKYISLGDMKNNEYTDKNPIEGMNEYRIDEYSNGKINKRAEIAVFFASQRNINIEGFYTNIEKLNKEIKKQGLFIYDINGRKIKKIENPGAYYIIREIDNQITNTEKVIIIY